MKKMITACMSLLIVYSCIAQKSGAFVRVYDSNNKKIYKGSLYALTDSSMILLHRKDTVAISATKIGVIKMRHTFGHTVALTTGTTAVTLALVGTFTGKEQTTATTLNEAISNLFFAYTPAEGARGGFALGAIAGAVTGSIISGARNRPIVIVSNSLDKWKEAKEFLKKYLPKPETIN